MALIVLLRGINVGGHRAFRPTLLARELGAYDVVNIGATGTFVVRKPGSRAHLRAELRSRLPVTTQFVFCEGRDLLLLDARALFNRPPSDSGIVRFVSFLARRSRVRLSLPLTIPEGPEWFVRVTTLTNRLAVGEYRRHMKAIGHLGQLDTLFGTLVTTRSVNTVNAILQILKDERGVAHNARSPRPRRISTKRANERGT
jgi:uncharacterized protein (DUF1697 family)